MQTIIFFFCVFKVPQCITVPYNRTSMSQKSCIPSSIRLWNSHADDLKDSSSLSTFNKFYISCVPPYFIMGNRYTSEMHARLRNNCGSLNNDLFEIMFVITFNPLCEWCDMMDDATHFFHFI